jgi:hypothetical protein
MNPALIIAILEQILIPEIAAIIRAHANATNGQLPNDAQVLAALDIDAAKVVAVGEAWLAAHPETPPAP